MLNSRSAQHHKLYRFLLVTFRKNAIICETYTKIISHLILNNPKPNSKLITVCQHASAVIVIVWYHFSCLVSSYNWLTKSNVLDILRSCFVVINYACLGSGTLLGA